MENINGKYQPRWMLLCATVCLIVSPCLAHENQSTSQEMRRLQEMLRAFASSPALLAQPREFLCDSLAPEVCLDIYRRRLERIPAPILSDDQGDISVIAAGRPSFTLPSLKQLQSGTRIR
jgi:hypothetical protein